MTSAPVLVMNVYYTGVGVARNLSVRNVEVSGLSSERDAPGMHSRFFRRIHMVPNGRDDPQGLCEALLALRSTYADPPVIFPTRDADVLFLNAYADRLEPHFRLPPAGGGLALLMDKLRLAEAAHKLNIPTPATIVCRSRDDAKNAASTLKFPVVIKPRSAHEWRRRGVWKRVGSRKAIFVATSEALEAEYARLEAVSPEILVQEYIAGTDSDIVVCCGYVGRDGRWLGHFTGRKLRQNPPLFGTGCVVEAAPVPTIFELSQRLLQACEYSGLAEVEFKRDPDTDRYFLIEVNPRHWDQHELGELVGVNLSWIAYQDALGCAQSPSEPTYALRRAPRWIAEREALLLIAKTAYERLTDRTRSAAPAHSRIAIVRAAAAECMDTLRKPRVFSILDASDPLPGLLFLGRLSRELLSLMMRIAPKHR